MISKDFVVPDYSPQQWLNGPSQKDKFTLRIEDHTMENIVLQLTKREITEPEVLPGDIVLYKIVASWTHLAIVVNWPDFILHPIVGRGVVGTHGTKEGFLEGRPRRFFSMFAENE